MISVWSAVLALGSTFVELTSGLPPFDDISAVAFGEAPDEIWVGTAGGEVWLSHDGGETYRLVFRPIDAEPLVETALSNRRAAFVGDLGRGRDRDLEPRDRAGNARGAADLSGSVRERPRDLGTPLLSSLVRPGARDRVAIGYISVCRGAVFLVTTESLWRSRKGGVSWERLLVGPTGAESEIHWLTCDPTRPGRLAVNTAGGVLESLDWGDSFARYLNPFGRADVVQTASLDAAGRLLVVQDNMVFRERADRSGYDRLCHIVGDSVDADQLRWAWWVGEQASWLTVGVTNDGVLVCDGEHLRRLADSRLARRVTRFAWVDTLEHLLVASEHEVFESHDGGRSFELAFTSPTQRTIKRVLVHPKRAGDLLVVTGGQIFRRLPPGRAAPARDEQAARRVEATLAAAPLWQVLHTVLERFALLPDQTAARRTDIRLRSLMPAVVVRAGRYEQRTAEALLERGTRASDMLGERGCGRTVWGAFVLWDLADLVHDPLQTDSTWTDIERLRRRISYRVQDVWAWWAREVTALDGPGLTPAERAYHEIGRREAAAYLHEMTGGAYAAFTPGRGVSRAKVVSR